MMIIQGKIADALLFKGYAAITLWPIIFVRTDVMISERLLNHERIHGRQQLEMVVIPFYVWYVAEWLIRLYINRSTAYRDTSFEREARSFENRPTERKGYGWVKYLHDPPI